MSSVGINPPKTPVTKGCMSIAKATVPNVCKMPAPPAPFAPAPLPNIAKSGMSPKGYSKKVKIEGNTVAIRGASYKSIGDVASKGTGGGLISANTHGPAKFITPGSLDVKIEGKSVHLLGEPMLNNCGASGSPPNTGATLAGTKHADQSVGDILQEIVCECDKHTDAVQEKRTKKANCRKLGEQKHDCCNDAVRLHNKQGKSPKLQEEKGYMEGSGAPDPQASRKWHRGASPKRFFSGISGRIFPDGAILDAEGNVDQFVEYKFQCPKDTPTRKKKDGTMAKPSAGTAKQDWTPGRVTKKGRVIENQLKRTKKLGLKQKPPVTKEPMLLTNEGCPK